MNALAAIAAVWGMLVLPVAFLVWFSDRQDRKRK